MTFRFAPSRDSVPGEPPFARFARFARLARFVRLVRLAPAAVLLSAIGLALVAATSSPLDAGPLRAGAAKIDITDPATLPANGPLFAKALIVTDDATTLVLITLDAVAVGEIGPIKNDYLPNLRGRLEKELRIRPSQVLVNASHCHGVVCADVEQRTFKAVAAAMKALEPVKVGWGVGREDRVMENRRLKLKDGREADVRHAYSLPPDEEVVGVGPVDPEIGLLRLDRLDGRTLAVVYNFACHPIQGVPNGANTADLTGFASQVVEDAFGDDAIALFVQGCGGDINPVRYKDVGGPRDAETLGNLLGLSAMKAAKRIRPTEGAGLKLLHETIELPRAELTERIYQLEAERTRLVESLKGTSLNLKTFLPLMVRYNAAPEFPSYYSHGYLHQKQIGRDDLVKLDAENRRNLEQYLANIRTMEQLTRVQTNLALLKKHQRQNAEAPKRTIDVEVTALRIGDFVMASFPGELTVQIGLNIKQASPHEFTFVAAYSNGYIYYAPTTEQLKNVGNAQEDSDCILAPHWQPIYEKKVAELLKKL